MVFHETSFDVERGGRPPEDGRPIIDFLLNRYGDSHPDLVVSACGPASLGLASMRERVRILQGELDIESTPGRGTTVVAWMPS